MKIPLIIFEVSNQCNLRCPYCYFFSKSYPDEMSTEKVLQMLHIFKNKYEGRVIAFSGGEPLLRKDIFQLISWCNDHDIKCSLATNGTTIDGSNVAKIKEHLKHVVVSYDGFLGDIDAFKEQQIFDGIECLLKASVPFSLHSTISVLNYKMMDDIVRFAMDVKAKRIDFNTVCYNRKVAIEEQLGNRLVLNDSELEYMYDKIHWWIKNSKGVNITHHLVGKYELVEKDRQMRYTSPLWNVRPDGSLFPLIDLDERWKLSESLADFEPSFPLLQLFLKALERSYMKCKNAIFFHNKKAINYFDLIQEELKNTK